MPIRFEKYRMKDGVTPLGERFFNPVFQDIDIRIAGLEGLTLAWEEAVRAVSEYGLLRINELIGPAVSDVSAAAVAVEEMRLAAIAAMEGLSTVVAITGRLTALETWQTGLAAELPDIEAHLGTLDDGYDSLSGSLSATQALMPLLAEPLDLGGMAIAAGAGDNHLAAVTGYGLYRYDPVSTEIADGETVITPVGGAGRWKLVAPHWDFVWAYLAGLFDDQQAQIDDLIVPVLHGSASLDFASIAAGASATLTVTVTGAGTSDRVVLTPPATLPNGLVPVAYVSGADTVTVRLNNVTAAGIDPAAMTYLVTIIKP